MLAIIAVATAALMGFAHYAAPRILRRKLHRLETYVVGVALGVLVPFAAWTWAAGAGWTAFLVLLAMCCAAGFGTVAAWALDAWGAANGSRDR